ncbi:zinc-dependent metalloprotease [Rhodohalobacter sp. 8-1]|uniref:zinc-dependent metalloprotease n=1 Tax=Rhodohalobacter sp. 8-1 TaxID=3131972 RepID=UPI0030EB1E69
MKRTAILLFLGLLTLTSALQAQTTISEKTAGMEHYEGFFDFWWDDAEGKIWMEIDKLDEEVLYVNSLAAGLGSNDIGLDRSQLGDSRVVMFQKIGPKLLMVQPNYGFRASSDNALERKSVDEAFAQSVLWGFTVEVFEDGHALIDATEFLLRDAHDAIGSLRSRGEGNYSLNAGRSAIHLPGTFNFPKNSEFEAILTFTSSNPGRQVRSVAPTAESVTLRQHHSFVELPDDDYQPREFDPRSGYFGISYQDYSTPIGEELTKRFISRHRLEKKNPDADVSKPVEPIIYYLDNGTPEPVRSALLDGARWWAEAFEELGYENAYQVEVLPDDAHPLDIRYNVINWVHRSTRGWSYGSSVTDPRTGEIIKGNVLLGSLRVRQDYMIAEGLLAPYEEGVEPGPEMLEMALARIRQLSAHEVGHTLGIAHNFASSTNDLASVMDYPHPRATITSDGELSLENAYDTGIGEWDKRSVAYGYQDFPENADVEEELQRILEETINMGLLYISDEAARPQSGMHPAAHLWEYGSDPVGQLDHIMDIRRIALDNFSEEVIREGRAMAQMEDVLVPIYLYHRYQTAATSKLIGGVDYTYSVRGDSQHGPHPVEASIQKGAMENLMRTLDPEELALPESLLGLIPPRPARISPTRELFRGYTDPALDPVAIAETASNLTAGLLLNSNRAARLVLQNARDESLPGLGDLFTTLFSHSVLKEPATGYNGTIHRAVNVSILRNALQLAGDESAAPDVKAITKMRVQSLSDELNDLQAGTDNLTWQAHYSYLSDMIQSFIDDPSAFSAPDAPYTPPGSPIGSGLQELISAPSCSF